MVHSFQYKKGTLHCEERSVVEIVQSVGTPCYIYSANRLRQAIGAYRRAFSSVPHIISYAMKANSNIAILRLFANEGGGADVVSEGELYRALMAGVDPQKIVFAGVGKRKEELAAALRANILMLNVESAQELVALDEVAKQEGVRARVALRVNPDVNPKTHPYISTGLKKSKFGIEMTQAIHQYRLAARLSHIDVVGIHSHIGSQLTQVKPFVDAMNRIAKMVDQLRREGFVIKYWDIGGGLGITYHEETAPTPKELAHVLLPILKKSGCTIILEPGRSLVGNAGILVTRVIYTKEGEAKTFVVVDAGMNDLIRPSLYQAYHAIWPVLKKKRPACTVDVVGPICESGDFFAQDREMLQVAPGELLAVMSAGAYGFSMASNYNARPRVPELLVNGPEYDLIRGRETLEDLIRGEQIPGYLLT